MNDRPSLLQTLIETLGGLVPPHLRDDVDVGVRRIGDDDWRALPSGERRLVQRAVEQRRGEFASGRRLLRDLLHDEQPIGQHPNGAPALPAGVVGSLAHDREFAVAAVSRREDVFEMGIDIECDDARLSRSEIEIIVRNDDVSPAPLAAFAMKEAAYKAWSTSTSDRSTDRVLEHSDVRVIAHGTTFAATILVDGTTFGGRFAQAAGRWLCLVIAER